MFDYSFSVLMLLVGSFDRKRAGKENPYRKPSLKSEMTYNVFGGTLNKPCTAQPSPVAVNQLYTPLTFVRSHACTLSFRKLRQLMVTDTRSAQLK